LEKSEMEELKKRLLEERGRLFEKASQTIKGRTTSGGPVEGDVLDVVTEARDRELALTMSEREFGEVRAIEDALERMEGGEYGECESCGEDIPAGRLQVRPQARLCVSCKSIEEKRRKAMGLMEADATRMPVDEGE
jgi:DnaK suppressor protein